MEKFPDVEWSFVTITARQDRRTEQASLYDLRDGWSKFRDKLKYRRGSTFHYLRVFERHAPNQKGERVYHLHALLGHQWDDLRTAAKSNGESYTYSRWMKDILPSCGLGVMSSADNLEKQGIWGVANYVTKYMTKEVDGDYPRHLRRFQTSRGWAKLEKRDNEWEMHGGIYYRDAVKWWGEGRDIVDIQTGDVLEAVHFVSRSEGHTLSSDDDMPYRPIDSAEKSEL